MKLRLLWLCLFVSVCATAQNVERERPVQPAASTIEGPAIVPNGRYVFMKGKLGDITSRTPEAFLADLLSPFSKSGNVSLVATRTRVDELGLQHVKFQQYINDLPVVGAEMVLHSDSFGAVYAVNGVFADDAALASRATLGSFNALDLALERSNIRNPKIEGKPELTYVLDQNGKAFLAWSAMVSYRDSQGPQLDRLFADASGSSNVVRHPQYHYAKNRRSYDGNNTTSLPGSLRRTEGQGSVGDAAVDAAHDNAGITYDFYKNTFNRDSYNGNGATMHSTAHHDYNLNNAYWTGSQMVYGDGDGSQFSYLSGSLDVVAHELTHAVTGSESNLTYQGESGALNESLSDVLGVSATIYYQGGINSGTWLLGEDVYTPGTPGDALRYMDDPARGNQPDYYPDRYTGSQDNGGVHINSGISNLAFYLLCQGGTHPRGKTNVSVPAIGVSQAQAIFYRANTTYLTASSNFQAMRNATAQAAADLYGSSSEDAVHKAWDAVGVPGGGGGGGGGNCSGTQYNGSLSYTGAEAYQPNGTYYYNYGGSQKGYLQGPSGTDFDLYLLKWNGSGWSTVGQGTSPTSTESVNYSGTAGYYTWRIHSYSGSGSYVFCLD